MFKKNQKTRRINTFFVFIFVSFLFLSSAFPAGAVVGVPTTLNYTGRLKNTSDNPVTGTYDFRFRLYDAMTDGTLMATEVVNDVAVNDGFFSARSEERRVGKEGRSRW